MPEGQMEQSLAEGSRSSGDLVPFTVSQAFQDPGCVPPPTRDARVREGGGQRMTKDKGRWGGGCQPLPYFGDQKCSPHTKHLLLGVRKVSHRCGLSFMLELLLGTTNP